VEVVKIREDKPIITLRTLCVKRDGTLAIVMRLLLRFLKIKYPWTHFEEKLLSFLKVKKFFRLA
jgi:hypothetical protein